MQLLVDTSSTIFVPLGSPIRSSLMMQYARENAYEYFKLPQGHTTQDIVQTIIHESKSKKIIVDGVRGTVQTLIEMEVKLNPDRLAVIQFGNTDNQEDKAVAEYYQRLAKYYWVDCVESVEQTYRNLRRATAPKVVFVFGPPLALKSQVSKAISQALGYTQIDFSVLRRNILKEKDGVVLANKFIKLSMNAGRNLVVDGFFQHPKELAVLEEYLVPYKVIHIKPTKDQVESKIKSLKQINQRTQKAKQFQHYIGFQKDLVSFLQKRPYYLNIIPGESLTNRILKLLYPPIVYIQSEGKLPQHFANLWGAVHLSPSSFAKSQIQRQTTFGGALVSHGTGSQKSSLYHEVIKMFKDIIYRLNRKVVLSGFPNNIQHFLFFQQQIAPISNYILVAKKFTNFNDHITPQMLYLMKQRLILQQSASNPEHLMHKLKKRKQYLVINGPQGCGKSTLAKEISKEYQYKLIQCQTYFLNLKEKLLTAEDGQQLPIAKVSNHFIELIRNQKQQLLFDGLAYEGKDLRNFLKDLEEVSYPVIINLKIDQKNLLKRNRIKAQSDVDAQVTEEDIQKMDELLEKNNNWLKTVQQSLNSEIKLFQLDFNLPLISVSKLLPSILKPRIFLITEIPPQNLIYINIALKYKMDYIDIKGAQSFQKILPNINKCRQRDIILVNYSFYNKNLVSDDINWIQSNVGVLRYMATWTEQPKTIVRDKIPLEKPKVQEKPKVFNEEGEQIKEEQLQPQDPDAPAKPKLDIYEHQWSVIGQPLNLTQWFLGLKYPNKQLVSKASDIFDEFDNVLKQLNNDRDVCIYQLIK